MRARVGTFLSWIGGGLTRVAATGVVTGALLIATGMSPAAIVAYLWDNPPSWVANPWLKVFIPILGLAVIGASLRFNLWSRKQKAIDALAEDISWAIRELVNWRDPAVGSKIASADEWRSEFEKWCEKVSEQLEDRAFFTRADQLYFDGLGFVDSIAMTGDPEQDRLLSQLRMKFERLQLSSRQCHS